MACTCSYAELYRRFGLEDPDVAEARIQADLEAGRMTVNQLRAARNYPPLEGGDVTLAEWRAAHPSEG